jgi:choice-of-anchor B domain-containing protein
MKTVGDHMYIGSEARNHGMQVFDMKKLLDVDAASPVTFSTSSDLAAFYDGFGNSHNIVANEETNMIYAVGTASSLECNSGLWMIDVSDPTNPTMVGCTGEDGYVHDAQCVIYTGPHEQYQGQEICFNYNEDTLTIVDVTDKSNPIQLSATPYDGSAYTHQVSL